MRKFFSLRLCDEIQEQAVANRINRAIELLAQDA
jgi:hypothetical protein